MPKKISLYNRFFKMFSLKGIIAPALAGDLVELPVKLIPLYANS